MKIKNYLLMVMMMLFSLLLTSCGNKNPEKEIKEYDSRFDNIVNHRHKMHPNQTIFANVLMPMGYDVPFMECEGSNLDYFDFAFNHNKDVLLIHCERLIEEEAHIERIIFEDDKTKIIINMDIYLSNDNDFCISAPDLPYLDLNNRQLNIVDLFIYDSGNRWGCFGLFIDNPIYDGMTIHNIYLDGCDEQTMKITGFRGNYIESKNRYLDYVCYMEFNPVSLPFNPPQSYLLIIDWTNNYYMSSMGYDLVFDVEYQGQRYLVNRPFSTI